MHASQTIHNIIMDKRKCHTVVNCSNSCEWIEGFQDYISGGSFHQHPALHVWSECFSLSMCLVNSRLILPSLRFSILLHRPVHHTIPNPKTVARTPVIHHHLTPPKFIASWIFAAPPKSISPHTRKAVNNALQIQEKKKKSGRYEIVLNYSAVNMIFNSTTFRTTDVKIRV